jgi:diaminopimelate epimerase
MNNPMDVFPLPDTIPISKLSGSGNDFVVIDNRSGTYSKPANFLARRLCARRYSAGADGLILIENSTQASFRVRFFNPDGNEFNTCGNGGRCAVRYVFLNGIADRRMTMETNIGVVDAEVIGASVRLKLLGPKEIRLRVPLVLDGHEFTGHLIQMGDPHYVVITENLREQPFVPLARRLSHHEALGPDGANVHFIEVPTRNNIRIRSYERGVEDETLACGSGCTATAIAMFRSGLCDPPIDFLPQSGIPLTVHFNPANNFQDLHLEGDARLIYRGELTREALTGFFVPDES